MSRRLRALIVGAGIGGLSAAIALRRAGVDALVFERATGLDKIQLGGGFHLWPNALRALRHMDLTEHAVAAGTPLEVTEYCNSRGALLGRWPIGELARATGMPDVGISRADLHRGVLAGAMPPDSPCLGAECVGFDQDAEGVTLRLAGGGDARGDVLVGADGLHSTVRARLLGPAEPRYAGYTQWQAVIAAAFDAAPPGVERVVFGPASRVVYHHVGGGRLFWAGITYGPPAGVNGAGRRAALAASFAGWPEPISAMIAATEEAQITWRDVYDRPPARRWVDGRACLLGDAAHPMTTNLSQGGCLAIEDAVVLADCLRSAVDVPAALRAYETRRIPRTSAFVRRSHRVAVAGRARNRLACAVRDAVFGRVFDGVAYRLHCKEMAHVP